ncbi:MAG: Gfo/Idh/MocA family oxidoreductase [Verrucomicrobiales bacterium]|nr:Gfo/Idh/MocA family oxidoreductase [Verrucomicrobiales bacterium]MCP5557428.1 Gfo/Idh/MocA family oxidoreductase [Verrucomicrobiaceae bacterium]
MINRRSFLRQGVAATLSAPAILSARSPNSNFQVASIGVGGMGGRTMQSVAQHSSVKMIGLCDVDSATLEQMGKDFADAKRFADFREMLSQLGDEIDGVTIGTPDHMHAIQAVTALRAKKHVYLQKPLTHHISEVRALKREAAFAGTTTQMGTQGHSGVEARMTAELIRNGAIGKVKEVVCWENKPATWWPKVTERKATADMIPTNLNWDLWLGVAEPVPFLDGAYHPKMWRAWTDFGVGMMGDMGCHYFDVVYSALGLTRPNRVRCLDEGSNGPLYASKRHLEYEFPATPFTSDGIVKMTWSDGGYPFDATKVIQPAALSREARSGICFIGETGSIFKLHQQRPWLVPDEQFKDYAYPKLPPADHYKDWVDAAMAGKKAATDLVSYGCPLTEAVLLGVIAERNPGAWIQWDADGGTITNRPELNPQLVRTYRTGWKVEGLG